MDGRILGEDGGEGGEGGDGREDGLVVVRYYGYARLMLSQLICLSNSRYRMQLRPL